MFYEAVGCIVSAEPSQPKRDEIIQELFRLPNSRWMEIIGLAMQDPSQLQNQETMRRHILYPYTRNDASFCHSAFALAVPTHRSSLVGH